MITKKCYFCNEEFNAELNQKLCKICSKKSILRSVKWHNFVNHLCQDREQKGTLFPLISIEEEGEHSFNVSRNIAQTRTKRGGNEVFENERIIEHYAEEAKTFFSNTEDSNLNKTIEIVQKTPMVNFIIPPCIWKNLWKPLTDSFLSLLDMLSDQNQCFTYDEDEETYYFNFGCTNSYTLCWCKNHKSF